MATSGPAARRRDDGFVVHLTDDLVPSIQAGRYRISVEQALPDVPTDGYLRPAEQRFEVHAPQFTLPPHVVHVVNPAPETAADHAMTLPHVTFADRLLPWQRAIDPEDFDTGPVEPRPPWLALLLFAPGELPGDPDAAGTTEPRTVKDLLWPEEPEPGVLTPRISREQTFADPADICETILVPGEVFAAVCPREDELRHLAHVRTVRADAALRGEELAEGGFSVIVANRLPRFEDGRHIAHLVSLEGCRAALGQAGSGDPLAAPVRLVSLHSWSFECIPADGAGFAVRMHDLLYDDDRDGVERDLLLRVPDPGSGGEAGGRRAERLAQGWVALPYAVDGGEETFAWYRGPFTAAPARPLPEPPERGWTEASQLLVYDERWGVFDGGWAAAWTLGRAMALADEVFTSRISAWRSRARYWSATLAQRLTSPGAEGVPDALTAARPAARALATAVGSGAAERLVRALSEVTEDSTADGAAVRAASVPHGAAVRTGAAPRGAAVHRLLTVALQETGPSQAHLAGLRTSLREILDEAGSDLDEWFTRLNLLHGVPFTALVPYEAMLPPESLKLFHIDPGWLTALRAGAESVAVDGELDELLLSLAAPWRRNTASGEQEPRAGLLLRSALVHECPELMLRAWQGTDPAHLLRRELLGEDMLLVLFDRVPDAIALSEPPEGLSFGIDPHPVDGAPVIGLRGLGAGGKPIGETIQNAYFPQNPRLQDLAAYLRPDPARTILDLRPHAPNGMLAGLGARLREAGQLPAEQAVPTPTQFALQLVNAPFRQLLESDGPGRAASEGK